MATPLDIAWLVTEILGYSALVVGLIGAGMLGRHLIRSAVSARQDGTQIPRELWQGDEARRAYWVMAVAAALLIVAIVQANVLPGRP